MSSSSLVTLKTNLADYPVTLAMKDGRVKSSLVKLEYCGPQVANEGFKPMVRQNAFEAGELAVITYLQAKAYGKPFVMLPAPISGRFQHHTIGYNKDLGQLSPKDIEGRKVGVRTYSQTTGVWVRGVLQHEYGVDLSKVTWLTVDEAHLSEHRDPPNVQSLPVGAKLAKMMFDGEIAAAILGGEMPKDPRVQTLIPDAKAEAQKWYAREGVIPINHVFVVRQELSRERPDVVRELYRMIIESRNLAPDSAKTTLPPIGLEENRKGLELAIEWSLEQKIIPRRLSVDELFDDTMAAIEN
jgi:4,5-dihydroxyphthalate decarboxylase